MEEIWKDILMYDGRYQVSNLGNVRSFAKYSESPRILKLKEDRDGYMCVRLRKDGKVTQHRVHRLVAETFLLNLDHKPTVNHIDGNKQNNNVHNLEWATLSEQQKHVNEHNLRSSQSVKVKCIETGQIFSSKRNAETTLGIMKNGVSRSIRTGKPVNGYTFQEIKRIVKKRPNKLFEIEE